MVVQCAVLVEVLIHLLGVLAHVLRVPAVAAREPGGEGRLGALERDVARTQDGLAQVLEAVLEVPGPVGALGALWDVGVHVDGGGPVDGEAGVALEDGVEAVQLVRHGGGEDGARGELGQRHGEVAVGARVLDLEVAEAAGHHLEPVLLEGGVGEERLGVVGDEVCCRVEGCYLLGDWRFLVSQEEIRLGWGRDEHSGAKPVRSPTGSRRLSRAGDWRYRLSTRRPTTTSISAVSNTQRQRLKASHFLAHRLRLVAQPPPFSMSACFHGLSSSLSSDTLMSVMESL